jgi:predicted nucleic acid-binding protein
LEIIIYLSKIEIHPISKPAKALVDIQYGALHQGELEAIQLSHEVNADLVLLDDLLGSCTE